MNNTLTDIIKPTVVKCNISYILPSIHFVKPCQIETLAVAFLMVSSIQICQTVYFTARWAKLSKIKYCVETKKYEKKILELFVSFCSINAFKYFNAFISHLLSNTVTSTKYYYFQNKQTSKTSFEKKYKLILINDNFIWKIEIS